MSVGYPNEKLQECAQCVFQMLVNLHNGGLVAAAVTVIWCCRLVSAFGPSSLANKNIPEKIVTTFRSCDQLYPSITN